jgi:hypothetical protein
MEILNLRLYGFGCGAVPTEQKKAFESRVGFALLYKDPRNMKTCVCAIFAEEGEAIAESILKADVIGVITTVECYHAFKALNDDKDGADAPDGKIIFGKEVPVAVVETAPVIAAVGGASASYDPIDLSFFTDLYDGAGASSAPIPLGYWDNEKGVMVRYKRSA